MKELIVGLHIHTVYSDGNATHAKIAQAALKAGLDVFITTDHNIWVNEMETYFQEGRKKVLLLIGEEVHDQTLLPGKNHLLVFGANRELSPFSKEPQRLIDQARKSGGLSFIAHPIEDPLETFGEKSYSWLDWDITSFTGIELWNQMSEFKSRATTILKAIWYAFFPNYLAHAPLKRTLALWDELIARGKPIVAIGGVDAHELQIHFGPFKLSMYPYEFHFRALTTHILVPEVLTGSLPEDKKMVLEALRTGHAFVAYDLPESTRGFRFTADNKNGQFIMGDRVSTQGGVTFQIRLPVKAHCRLLKDGKVIKETFDREVCTHITTEPGVYRAEVYLNYLGKKRGWIFSNPIYACG